VASIAAGVNGLSGDAAAAGERRYSVNAVKISRN